MAGVRRTLGTAPAPKAALSTPQLRQLLAALPDTLAARRDRALLLLGFAGAFRRDELVALRVEDVEWTDDGLRPHLRSSKTDQVGAGREVGIVRGQHPQTCPVRALRAWLDAAGIDAGPLFRPVNRHDQIAPAQLTPSAVARVAQRAARRAGLDPARYAGHSLRAGHATEARGRKAPREAIKAQTGHRGDRTLDRYLRRADLFDDNSSAYLGL